jgi:hypothetical protein
MLDKIILKSVVLILYGNLVFAQPPKSLDFKSNEFPADVSKWFAAWNLISKDVYGLKNRESVEFVFFDDQYVYSTSAVTIPKGERIKGPLSFNQLLKWKRALHRDSILLPDSSKAEVNIMSFASPLTNNKSESYFVMPLPSFWNKAGVTSKELGFDNLITGVFLHEFSHSQQMQSFGKKISSFENTTDFGIPFSDDIIQHLFQKDSAYVVLFKQELNCFERAVTEKSSIVKKELIKKGIELLRKRHQQYFISKYESLKNIDEFFLTMEGLGQFTMYSWFVHPKGANLAEELAVKGTRRGGRWWSQDEGLLLFLILNQLSPPQQWAYKMFGSNLETVVKLIEQNLKE